jgi:PAS domain S-box-containing protein
MKPLRNKKLAKEKRQLFLEKENRELNDALKESRIKYKTLTETARDYIFIVNNKGIVEYVNSYAANVIRKKPEQLIGLPLNKVFHPDLHKRQITNIMKVIKTGKPLTVDTESIFAGKSYWLSTSLSPIFDDKKNVKSVLGISRDITKRVVAEQSMKESEEKYRELIEQAADSILVGDTEGNFINVNSKACELTGYRKTELLKMNMCDLFTKKELQKRPFRYDLLLKGEVVVNERKLTRKDKTTVTVEMNTVRMSNGNNQAIMRDITERKKAEEFMLQYQEDLESLIRERTHQLEKANLKLKKENTERLRTESLMKFQLKEKEILLKEIHHRVKNNMQVIISLLNLQAATIDDNKIHELYKESQNRIKSMALIHERLYQSKDFTHIDFKEYVTSLSNYLAHTYLSEGSSVKIVTKTQNIPLEYDTAISLGLIINELVSNSMKYAFEGIANGRVEISLIRENENLLRLCVADNGKGIPKHIDFRNTKSLGLQLVCSLAEQIGGGITMENHDGTKFCIQFHYKHK